MTKNKERKWPAGTADKINEWAESHLGLSLEPWQMDLLRQTEVPQPRTLADMTRDERKACQWMQADFDHGFADPPLRVVIGKCHGGTTDIILSGGGVSCAYTDKIIPLPDLPRMVWPDEQATEETPDPPRPEDVPEGEVWMIRDNNGTEMTAMKLAREAEKWDWVTTGGQHRADRLNFYKNKAVTLVSRMVPEKGGVS